MAQPNPLLQPVQWKQWEGQEARIPYIWSKRSIGSLPSSARFFNTGSKTLFKEQWGVCRLLRAGHTHCAHRCTVMGREWVGKVSREHVTRGYILLAMTALPTGITDGLDQCFPSVGVTDCLQQNHLGKFLKSTDSQAPFQTHWIWISKCGLRNLYILKVSSRGIMMHNQA